MNFSFLDSGRERDPKTDEILCTWWPESLFYFLYRRGGLVNLELKKWLEMICSSRRLFHSVECSYEMESKRGLLFLIWESSKATAFEMSLICLMNV